MTKKQEVQKPDYDILKYGGLSGYLGSREVDQKHVKSALTILAGPEGVGLNENQRGFMEGSLSNDESTQNTGQIYGKQYRKAVGKATVGELAAYYTPLLRGVDKEAVANIAEIMGEVKDRTRGSIEKAYKDAVEARDSKSDKYSPEDKAKARRIIRKFNPVMALFQTFDEYEFEGLRPKAVDKTRVSQLKELSDKL